MSRRRSLIIAIVTAGCWIALLAIVRSEFKLARQSEQGPAKLAEASVNLPSRNGPTLPKVEEMHVGAEDEQTTVSTAWRTVRKPTEWTFKDERHLIALAASQTPLEVVAVKFKRSVDSVRRKAAAMSISLTVLDEPRRRSG
jgi:hypothetical protein